MVEGTINSCNSLFYCLEKKFNVDHQIINWTERVRSVKTDEVFIPGFCDIASPYWKIGFKNILIGLDNNINQIARAAMGSIGLLINDILNCLKK